MFQFCRNTDIIGVGWTQTNIRTDDYWELKSSVEKIYPDSGSTAALKAINAMREMDMDDLIYTRFEGKYYICRVTGRWINTIPTDDHYRYDICNYVNVEWADIGTEDSVPGKVINSFGPSATVQRVCEVENVSKLLWNNFTVGDYRYSVDPIRINDFWQVINSEDLECLVLLYLQSKGYYIYSSTLKRSTAKIECVLIKNDGSHKGFPQVKREATLSGRDYENLLKNQNDKVFLFSTSQNYQKYDNTQIVYLSLDEIENFIRLYKSLLPLPILNWVMICDDL